MNKHFAMSTFLLATLLSVFLLSCKHDADVAENPQISYGINVKPIIAANCAYSGCHSATNFQRFSLATYNDVIINGEVSGKDAINTRLYKSMVGRGAEIMPPSPKSPLSDIQIKTVLLWLKQGAKNN